VARIDFDEQIAATVAPVRIEVEKMKQGGQHFARPILLIDRECGHLADRSAAFAVPIDFDAVQLVGQQPVRRVEPQRQGAETPCGPHDCRLISFPRMMPLLPSISYPRHEYMRRTSMLPCRRCPWLVASRMKKSDRSISASFPPDAGSCSW
jgi:hypothetical protein